MGGEPLVVSLVTEIRSCQICKRDSDKVPFVFCSNAPGVMVISEGPPKLAWDKNTGKAWESGDLIAGAKSGTGLALCRQLEVDPIKFSRIVFWMQRRNCWLKEGVEFALQNCSEEYMKRAIETVDPKIIVLLGKVAAQYFFQFDKMEDIIGFREYKLRGKGYDCCILYHPSAAAGAYHRNASNQETLAKLKKIMDGIIHVDRGRAAKDGRIDPKWIFLRARSSGTTRLERLSKRAKSEKERAFVVRFFSTLDTTSMREAMKRADYEARKSGIGSDALSLVKEGIKGMRVDF